MSRYVSPESSANSQPSRFKPTARNVLPANPLRSNAFNIEPHSFKENNGIARINTYHADILAINTKRLVKICHYDDGPFLFFVQFEDKVDELHRMMGDLQDVEHEKLDTTPVVGMACLADFQVSK